ncbi:SET domain protein 20 [Tasmannia lanceolata]|uniref:SET domain protein 20 n=1 Tax=Tasmannia lanceolata TaxID=3420 RepID=UPI004063A579
MKKGSKTQEQLFEWAHLVLPWLSLPDLASISSTCKSLHHISKSITTLRVSDASRSFEKHPIPFLNTFNNHLYSYFIYTPIPLLKSPLSQPWGGKFMKPISDSQMGFHSPPLENAFGCVCKVCCEENDGDLECPCSNFGWRVLGLGVDMGMISECGVNCKCGSECKNRLTQRGISIRLKIVRDSKKGWGLHTDEFVRRGEFVCEYAGELLTTEVAKRRQRKYDELASHGRFSSAILVVREHLPSGKACLRMNIDATRVGNIARFINHSCDGGNLSTVLVRNSGALLPRICFFAARDILEGEELAFSYGDVRLKPKGMPCFCASSCCLGLLPSEPT